MKVSFRFNRCYRQTSIRKKNIFRKNEGGINGGIYRRCDRQFANFFLIYISYNLKMLKKKKLQIPNKTNKDRFQRNMKHLKFASWKQPRGRPRFKENKFPMEEARKLLTPQRTLDLFPISYRLNLKKNHKQNKKEFLIEHTSTPQTCVQRTFQSQCSTRTHIVLNKRTQPWKNLEKASSPILPLPLPSLAVTRSFPPLEKETWWRGVYLKFSSV